MFLLHALLTASFVALPFLLRNELQLALTGHWKVYVLALLLSLAGTVPLIIADERGGRSWTLTAAIALLIAGELALALAGFSVAAVVAALAVFFAGFNFLEAGLPARLVERVHAVAGEGRDEGHAPLHQATNEYLGASHRPSPCRSPSPAIYCCL